MRRAAARDAGRGGGSPAIRFEDVWKTLGRAEVFRGMTLEVRRGETLVVIGRSGMGKSVLLKHIVGLMKPDRGSVVVEGREVPSLPREELFALRRGVGMLFQNSALFDSLTVAENVGLGLAEQRRAAPAEIERRVVATLAMVGLEQARDLMPSELSGGMRKRVGLARALATEPSIMLYDEPTTGLDPVTAGTIDSLIRDHCHDRHITGVAVTHDMKSAFTIGDRIALLHDGRIAFEGTVEETRRSEHPLVRRFVEGRADEGDDQRAP